MAAAPIDPLHVFRFQVEFRPDSLLGASSAEPMDVCNGAFAECSGLEATMEPKVIKEGGRNFGHAVANRTCRVAPTPSSAPLRWPASRCPPWSATNCSRRPRNAWRRTGDALVRRDRARCFCCKACSCARAAAMPGVANFAIIRNARRRTTESRIPAVAIVARAV